jgi:hypothetical protein
LSTIVTQFVTISCDTDGCGKTATFPATDQGQNEALVDHPWLNSLRTVLMPDQRKLTYCSDECEAKGIAAGTHNKLEPKKIISAGNQAQVDLAARAAQQAADATAKLKQGQPVTLQG